jgi:8-oxo-dGTP pyrophosphatase MutT (NUDIX family)
MAVCLLMQFAGVDAGTYEEVMEELGLRGANPDWPSGIISHVAGFTSDGMYVVDVWESQEDFDAFVESRLQPAFEAVGGIPEPQVTKFDVHNSYTP